MRIKSFIFALIFNVMLISIGVVFLELAFGDWIGEDSINRLNLIRDRIIVYEVGDLYDSPSENIIYTRDEYGLRGQFGQPGDIEILTVGGSTTDQRYISDGQTWEAVLQQQLQLAGKDIVVANAGVDGQSTFGHVKNFDWWFPTIPGLKPEYVLYFIGLNDFYKDEGNGYDALVKGGSNKSLWHKFKERSALYNMQRVLQGIYQAEIKQKIGHKSINLAEVEYVTAPLQTSYDELMRVRLKEYRERLEVLVRKTRELGAQPIFVTQPSRKYRHVNGQVEGVNTVSTYDGVPYNGADYYRMLRKLDEVTKSVAMSHGIVFVDVGGVTSWEDRDFYDYMHMTPSGASKVGKYISGELINRL